MKAVTKKQLSKMYSISLPTLSTWLKKIPNLDITPYQQILTPKQVEIIFEHLGRP